MTTFCISFYKFYRSTISANGPTTPHKTVLQYTGYNLGNLATGNSGEGWEETSEHFYQFDLWAISEGLDKNGVFRRPFPISEFSVGLPLQYSKAVISADYRYCLAFPCDFFTTRIRQHTRILEFIQLIKQKKTGEITFHLYIHTLMVY